MVKNERIKFLIALPPEVLMLPLQSGENKCSNLIVANVTKNETALFCELNWLVPLILEQHQPPKTWIMAK